MKNTIENTVAEKKTKQQAKGRASRPHSYKTIGGIVGFGLGLIINVQLGFFLFERNVETKLQHKLHALANQHAQTSAENVAEYLQGVWEKLARYTDRPEIVSSLAKGDAQHHGKVVKEIKNFVDNAVGVKLIKAGEAKLNPDVFPPIRFSELDMIRRAERRQEVFPEAARFDGQWIMTFVAPLPADENREVVGTLVLSVAATELERLVVRDQVSQGNIRLVQKFTGATGQVLVNAGKGGAGGQVTKKVNNSYFAVEFTPSHALKPQFQPGMLMSYAWIFSVLLVVLVIGTIIGRIVGVQLDKKSHTASLIEGTGGGVSPAQESSDLASGPPSNYPKADILDVEINEEGEGLLGLDEVEAVDEVDDKETPGEKADEEEDNARVPLEIFRAYDIRGIAKTQIDKELAENIGRALGSEAIDAAQEVLIVARDGRLSSPELTEWLIRGILSTGCNVVNIGTVPTPLLYFATCTMNESQSGVMVTASHNPKEYNGFKVVINGKSRSEEDIKAIRTRILHENYHTGSGEEFKQIINQKYIDTIFSDVALAGDISIVIDAANGVTGNIAPKLFEELGCHVTRLHCDLNGEFPNHEPDPSVEKNLRDLIAKVIEVKADLGVAFDGDGDRLVVVTPQGKIVWPDQLLMLFAKDVLSRNPGADVVFDVKSTRHLASCVTNYGGRPIMWKTGHAPMKNKMLETGALLGGEYSGHIFIKDRWYGFDDGMYAAARLIEIISLQGEPLDDIFAGFPASPVTPEVRIPMAEDKKFAVMKQLAEQGGFEGGRIIDIDGIRVEYPFGWGLIRASNTSGNLTMRFEADDEESLHKLKAIFVKELRQIDSSIQVNWDND